MVGYKIISMALLVVLVALAGLSPVFAASDFAVVTLDPTAACPGVTVTVNLNLDDVVGGGISVAAMSPLVFEATLSSDPLGLVTNQACYPADASHLNPYCTFVVSESATCGGHYNVIVTVSAFQLNSPPFDVPKTCCPVGGCVQPANTLALVSPWMAVIGLVGCIGAVAAVAKKRRP